MPQWRSQRVVGADSTDTDDHYVVDHARRVSQVSRTCERSPDEEASFVYGKVHDSGYREKRQPGWVAATMTSWWASTRRICVSVLVVTALALTGTSAVLVTARPAASAAPAPAQRGQLANLDDAKQNIRSYYGDYVDATGAHQASPDSEWARHVAHVDARAQAYVERRARDSGGRHLAMVLDIDDTALSTYSYGAENDFAFHDDTKTAQWALAEKLPVIPATLALARSAHGHGVALFFVTGRPPSLTTATLGNLRKAGYPAATAIFLEPEAGSAPAYLHCASACTTVEYKSGTRAHIESLGYDVVADVGDQQSDLDGGHTDATFKLPNPMYVTP
jgi:phosphoglycolate phosphatase-like HAD superfamily hydrolase